jgi:hypothetical protein
MPSMTNSFKTRTWLLRRPAADAAIVLAALAILTDVGCNKADNHVPVHPVVGAIKFRGQPAEGAFISLVPKSAIDGVPNPRATVVKDGTFMVSTYDGNDGAPEGEYVVTVQWYKPVRQGADLVGGPNVLPTHISSAKTSDVIVRVAAGENRVPPIQLR